jgi:plastocyanin domain-containing protein
MQKVRLASILVIIGLSFYPCSILSAEMQREPQAQSNQFRRIEQSAILKIAVTVGGLTLIGGQLWWFLGSKPKSQQAEAIDRNIDKSQL